MSRFSGISNSMGNFGAAFSKINPVAIALRGLDMIAQKIKTTDRELVYGKEVVDKMAHDMEGMARTSQEAARIYNEDRDLIAEGKAQIGDASHTLAGLGLITGIATGDVKVDGLQKVAMTAVDAASTAATTAAVNALDQSQTTAIAAATQVHSDMYRAADDAHQNLRQATYDGIQNVHQNARDQVEVPRDLNEPGQH